MRQRAASVRSWLASNPVEVVFALLVTGAVVYSMRITGREFFYADDWLLIKQAGSARGLVEPYNGHLSLVILGSYRVLVEAFGFTYEPFRLVSILSLFAVPAAYFLSTRRQLGALLAGFLAIPLVWYGRYISLDTSAFNHYLALVGGIACAAALNRGRRADVGLAAALLFSLCSAGGGVAVAAACVVHSACTRAPVRRWLAVAVPVLLWAGWWLIEVRRTADLGPYALTTSQTLRFVRDLSYTPFEGAALGVAVIAIALIAAYAGYGIWSVSKGLNAGANFLAWSVALLIWGLGVANSRGALAPVTLFRYRYVALGFVLLAVVPRRPIVWPAPFPMDSDRRWAVAGAGVILAVGCARGLAVRTDMQSYATQQGSIGQVNRGRTLVVGLDPSVVPDTTVLRFGLGYLRASEMRLLLADYGNPFPATPATADRRLVDMGLVTSEVAGTRGVGCTRLRQPFVYRPTRQPLPSVWSPDAPSTVDVRRFGHDWVRLGEAGPGDVLKLILPSFDVDEPYEIRANGACLGPQNR